MNYKGCVLSTVETMIRYNVALTKTNFKSLISIEAISVEGRFNFVYYTNKVVDK